MKRFRIWILAAFVFAVASAFTTKAMLIEDHGTYFDDYDICSVGPLKDYTQCSTTGSGAQCSAYGYNQYGQVVEFPAYYYNRPNAYCLVPLYYPY